MQKLTSSCQKPDFRLPKIMMKGQSEETKWKSDFFLPGLQKTQSQKTLAEPLGPRRSVIKGNNYHTRPNMVVDQIVTPTNKPLIRLTEQLAPINNQPKIIKKKKRFIEIHRQSTSSSDILACVNVLPASQRVSRVNSTLGKQSNLNFLIKFVTYQEYEKTKVLQLKRCRQRQTCL